MDKPQFLPLKDDSRYVRDTRNGALVMKDHEELDKYHDAKVKKLAEMSLRHEVEYLKRELASLTAMVKKLHEKE